MELYIYIYIYNIYIYLISISVCNISNIGIPSLKQQDIITRLKLACEGGDVNSRQGSLFAFEFLSLRLGLLFEPFVISIVPSLLKSFSHSSDHVREACGQTTKTIMGKLSGILSI
jgi:hypothetical protein